MVLKMKNFKTVVAIFILSLLFIDTKITAGFGVFAAMLRKNLTTKESQVLKEYLRAYLQIELLQNKISNSSDTMSASEIGELNSKIEKLFEVATAIFIASDDEMRKKLNSAFLRKLEFEREQRKNLTKLIISELKKKKGGDQK